MRHLLFALALAGVSVPLGAMTIDLNTINEKGEQGPAGMVRAEDSAHGLLLTPRLTGLPPGAHGFHLHDHPDCAPAMNKGTMESGMAAAGHWDPQQTGRHAGPYGEGHQGDLPVLFVDADGRADTPVLAPRVKEADLQGHALMIHAGGDTYRDDPALGGGGKRIACGIVQILPRE